MSSVKRGSIIMTVLSLLLMSCVVNPVTQKREIMLFSDQDEIKMGKDGHEAVMIQFGKFEDPSLQKYADQVGQNIAVVSHRKDLTHHYMVVDSAVPNAFALPGGYVYINRGLLPYLNNEAQFASVLAHETAHIAARHSVKKYQKAVGAQLVLIGVAVASESQGISLGTSVLLNAILQGYSRKDENQSDELGTLYLYKAGYNPMEMSEFFKTLEFLEKKNPDVIEQLFASHPPTPDRMKKTDTYARELTKGNIAGLTVERNRYISHLDGLVFGPGEREGIIVGTVYKNRYFRYQVQMPEGWKIQRGDAAGSVVGHDPSKRYLAQVISLESKKKLTPRQLAVRVERDSGLQPYSSSSIIVNGENAYRADYRAQSQNSGWVGLRIVYLTRGKTGFVVANMSRLQDFADGVRTFNSVISSFHLLSAQQAATIPLYRLKVHMVRAGDTFASISTKFYRTSRHADNIKQFNGMSELDNPPVGALIKIKPLIPEKS